MKPNEYWKSVLKERDDLNRAPSADITLRQSDIKDLVLFAYIAGQKRAATSPASSAESLYESLFGKR